MADNRGVTSPWAMYTTTTVAPTVDSYWGLKADADES